MNRTLKLVSTAMLTALSIVTNIFTIPLGHNNTMGFTIVFSFVAGIYLGIVPAIAVGYIGDLLAHFIHPMGAYNWYIAISSLLFGLIPALVYKMKCKRIFKLLISAVICFVVCSCFLNNFGLWLNYIVGVEPGIIGLIEYIKMDGSGIKKSFWLYLWGRLPFAAINFVVNMVIVGVLQETKALDKLILKLNDGVQKRQTKEQQIPNETQQEESTNQQ